MSRLTETESIIAAEATKIIFLMLCNLKFYDILNDKKTFLKTIINSQKVTNLHKA
jgi:hypothetical protein